METYEQKYKEALERAKELKNKLEKSCSLATPTGIETIFPELAESKDERIRKSIIEVVKASSEILEKQNQRNMIAWLEKQGETFTKRDVDDAYLKGICDAKRELEKQGEKKPAKRSDKEFDDFFNLESVIDIVEMYGKGEVDLYGSNVTSELEWLKLLKLLRLLGMRVWTLKKRLAEYQNDKLCRQ